MPRKMVGFRLVALAWTAAAGFGCVDSSATQDARSGVDVAPASGQDTGAAGADPADAATKGDGANVGPPDAPPGPGSDAPGDTAGGPLHPECRGLAALVLSDPRIAGGTLAAGQSATVQVTITNAGAEDYRKYPGATLSSRTPGISFATKQAGVALLRTGEGRILTWRADVAAGVSRGTTVEFLARVVGAGQTDCPNADTLAFMFTLD
jgi:hypothetical protein